MNDLDVSEKNPRIRLYKKEDFAIMHRAGKLRADMARITQDLATEFEVLISAAPQQWHLMQPNWPSDSP